MSLGEGSRTQAQDSLHDQMMRAVRMMEREGLYDAADWIKAHWNMPKYDLETALKGSAEQRAARRGLV